MLELRKQIFEANFLFLDYLPTKKNLFSFKVVIIFFHLSKEKVIKLIILLKFCTDTLINVTKIYLIDLWVVFWFLLS